MCFSGASMKKVLSLLLSLALLVFFLSSLPVHAQTPAPVVRAVLFYSPTCPHCHYVINEVLPPLFEKYGDQLQIIGIDVTQPQGQQMFVETVALFGLERAGVPFLVVGDTYLLGSVDIPEKFPAMIEAYLAAGGVDWPNLPGLSEQLAALQQVQSPLAPSPTGGTTAGAATPSTATPEPSAPPSPTVPAPSFESMPGAGLAERLARDPLANAAAIIVLVGMLVVLGWGAWRFFRLPGVAFTPSAWRWAVFLAFLGLLVAAYLAFVEMTSTEAFCGPVGDCNAVQQSKYARLFGIVPIGLLGFVEYAFILAALGLYRFGKGKLPAWAALAILVMTLLGTLFSVYLTFLEPFVIGAVCLWCLTSAVLITVLFLFSIPPAKQALADLKA